MKKKIYLILTIIISLFMFSSRAEALSMYLECDYTSECDENTKEWYNEMFGLTEFIDRWCLPTFRYYIPLTDKNGNLSYYVLDQETPIGSLSDPDQPYVKLDMEYNDQGCWLNKFTTQNCKSTNVYSHGVGKIFTEGMCPSGVVNGKGFSSDVLIPFGKDGTVISKSDIDETKYVIYSFNDANNNRKIIAEGYSNEGKYCYAGPNIKDNFVYSALGITMKDEISSYIHTKAVTTGPDYWKVHTDYKNRIIASNSNIVSLGKMNVCDGLSEEQCKNGDAKYEVIIDSEDSNNGIKNAVKNWFDLNVSEIDKLSSISSIVGNSKFIETCNDFNKSIEEGKKYTFSSNYTIEMFVNDLKKGYESVKTAFSMENTIIDYSTGKLTSPSSSVVSYIYKYMLGIDEFVEIAEKNNKEYYINIEYIIGAIKRDVGEAIESYMYNNDFNIDVLHLTESLSEYAELFYTSVVYLDENLSNYSFDSNYIKDLKDLKDNFKKFIDENNLNVYPVVDCESLLGEKLIGKINEYLSIFKIAVPIILVGFGIIDFVKCIFVSDEEKMKKAKDDFIKRLFISVLIFLSPIFINLLLNIANKVWGFISPNSCGIF